MQKSVALCTYNGEKYIREQLDSILKQNVAVTEIVVCDDHSTDQTFSILLQYQLQHPELFKIYQNKENLGYVKNFEKTIMLCSGDLIFLCDQDDYWYENKVEKVEKAFLENKNIRVLCHNINLLGNDIKNKNYWELRNFSANKTNAEILETTFLSGNIFPGMAMVIDKKAQQNYFPLKKLNRLIIHDFELILQSSRENTFFAFNEILGDYRLHEEQNIGFDERNSNPIITAENIYTRRNSLEYIQKTATEFNLDQHLVEKYKADSYQYFEQYLNQFSFWKRIWQKMKMTYYYKIK